MVILFMYQYIFAQALSVHSMDRIYRIYKYILIHLFGSFTLMMAGVKGRRGVERSLILIDLFGLSQYSKQYSSSRDCA